MKTTLILAAAAFFSLHSAWADWVIIQKVTTDQAKDMSMSIKAKGDKSRMDMGDQMSLILDSTTGDSTMFMHPQKMMMKLSADSMKGIMAMAAQQLGSEPSAKPKATGQKEKVGEHECEIYTWEGKLGTGKFWVAKDFPNAKELNELQDKMMKSMGNPMSNLVPQNSDFPGIVVKSEMAVMGKKNVSEFVSAKQEALSDDIFKTPEGYQEMKTPGLPGK
jgi:hypothetical protein